MLFSSLVFVFNFLPILLLVYLLVPNHFRNIVLLVFSLVFYAWGGFSYTLVLLISIVVNWLISIQINKVGKRLWLVLGISINLCVLIIFKYLNFFIDNINLLLIEIGLTKINNVKINLPLGISFFTFQQMSMLWDIYRSENRHKIRFVESALYVSLFPQLIAGPIVRYHDIIGQIRKRVVDFDLINSGIKRFIYGLFKKVVIANTCAEIADDIFSKGVASLSMDEAWLGIGAYTLQIFFDFSGYSDMAIGLGRIFGFRILENFNFPYISKSIQEFWRRWHISLSNWFKDYLYIPLGGNRLGIRRTYLNLFIVFALTGFWHGSTWSFVVWGLFHGLFLIIERIGFGKFLKRIPSIFSWFYTMLVVIIGWVFFRIEHVEDAFLLIGQLFSFSGGIGKSLVYLNPYSITIFFIAILMCTPILERIIEAKLNQIGKTISVQFIPYTLSTVFFMALFFYTCIVLATTTYNPFIYFRF